MRPIFADSTFLTVQYELPFGLDIEKPPKNFPCPVVTKDSKKEKCVQVPHPVDDLRGGDERDTRSVARAMEGAVHRRGTQA